MQSLTSLGAHTKKPLPCIRITLHGVTVDIQVKDPVQYSQALRDARLIASRVRQGTLHWADGIALAALRAEYYSSSTYSPATGIAQYVAAARTMARKAMSSIRYGGHSSHTLR